ncbi:AarF/ABC1/UbiB kinase family protein [Tsukamurella tyrosinosolvens]|uniref:ABC1 kinase family protein n=1 Tax=Tsukamurella tyrosinosolvens TaxID=57704 RepID=UPI00079B22DA|nr:AarF/ABC1/UbiB kinase family protein [Tsukamurella tyrosinosolvens]KXP07507.1 ABC transporter ATP-binding protein [Tsukamurella tyrosinosolvens]KZL98709.1 ABC transporter ATP-binding protein [Tsukamurella tyrosinosolvens]MCA4994928.1 AarF/ABC1/UbiB kinase family protein [Tsukamurella tyrosinosolvens]WEL92874.1 AarF/ABC1/UbiB kinase family protein [Tsukamurella tyrosinosolvens]
MAGRDPARQPDGASAAPSGRIRRSAQIGGVAVRHAARTAGTLAASRFRDEQADRDARDATILALADDLVTVLGGMRGAAMKLGQLLAVIDIGITEPSAREAFADRLKPLFQAAPRWTDAAMMKVLDQELGARRGRIARLEGPIASASIGQVYRGVLDDGRDVAVKIQYPRVDAMVRADLKNMRLLLKVLGRYIPASNAAALSEEIARQVLAELDFAAELRHHRYFADLFAGHPGIAVPQPVDELCSDRVLVTEFLVGEPFAAAAALDQDRRNRLGEAVYRFYCGEMYRTGRFCADPHPGNVLVLPDGRAGFVDFGMTVHLTDEEHAFERDLFTSLLRGDTARVHTLAVQAGFIGRPDLMDAGDLAEYIDHVVGWHLHDGEVTITPETARDAVIAATLPAGGFFDKFEGQMLQAEHALGRRTDMSTVALLGELRATGPWRAIACEVLGLDGPATPMGVAIAEWRDLRGTDAG